MMVVRKKDARLACDAIVVEAPFASTPKNTLSQFGRISSAFSIAQAPVPSLSTHDHHLRGDL